MRTISFVLAFGLLLAGPSMAGSADASPPGAGTFAYKAAAPLPAALIQLAIR